MKTREEIIAKCKELGEGKLNLHDLFVELLELGEEARRASRAQQIRIGFPYATPREELAEEPYERESPKING